MRLHRRRYLPFMIALLAVIVLGLTLKLQLLKLDNAIRDELTFRNDLQARQTAQTLAPYQPLMTRLATPLPTQAVVIGTLQEIGRHLQLTDVSYTFLAPRAANGVATLPLTMIIPGATIATGFNLPTLLEETLPNAVQLTSLTFERRSDGTNGQVRVELSILGTP